LLRENARSGLPAIVLDYSNSFTESQIDDMDPNYRASVKEFLQYIDIKKNKLPINPFKLYYTADEERETESDAANRIANLFAHIFKFQKQQRFVIYDFFRLFFFAQTVTEKGADVKLPKDLSDETVNRMKDQIIAMKDDINPLSLLRSYLIEFEGSLQDSANRVLSAMASFIDMDLFSHDTMDWDEFLGNEGKITIIELGKYGKHNRNMILEFLLWDLWDYVFDKGSANKPFVVVFDECQELNYGDSGPISTILRQDRKFGLSAWFITQYLHGDDKFDAGAINSLEQAANTMYFRPTNNDVRYLADKLEPDDLDFWMGKLRSLGQGQCIVKGYFVKQGNQSRTKECPPKIINIPRLQAE